MLMKYAQALAKLRKSKGYTQSEVAGFISRRSEKPYSLKMVSHWENGVSSPPVEQFLLLCEMYGVMDIQSTFRGINTQYRNLSKLNDLGKSRVEEYIEMLSGSAVFSLPPYDSAGAQAGAPEAVLTGGPEAALEAVTGAVSGAESSSASGAAPAAGIRPNTPELDSGMLRRRVIKLYEIPAAAGFGNFLDSSSYDDFEVDETVPDDADFAVRVSGDSMTPRFVDSQIIFIKEQQLLDVGEIGIFSLNGDSYVKKLGRGELISLNKRYSPIPIGEYDAFYIFGKVVG